MKSIAFILLFFLATSCVFMPLRTPRHFKYQSITKNDYVNQIDVFDAPMKKTYHFFAQKDLKVKGCSKVFSKKCSSFKYEDFFERKKYTKKIRIKDGEFLSLLKIDTLELFINGKKILFIPSL